MNPFQSTNQWTWNCSPKNDLDVMVYWGNQGELTLQISSLRGITYLMDFWNERDNRWISFSASQMLDAPTSNPVTFHGVAHSYAFAKKSAHLYWGNRYRINATLMVFSGPAGGTITVAE